MPRTWFFHRTSSCICRAKGFASCERNSDYAVPTLEALAFPFAQWKGAVVPVLDAKKNRFYAAIYRNGKENTPAADASIESIATWLDKEEDILAAGPDAEYFAECLTSEYPELKVTTLKAFYVDAGQQLLEIANKMYLEKKAPIQEYDGPVYIRPSEAEEKRVEAEKNNTDAIV